MEAVVKEAFKTLDCQITFDLTEHINRNELIHLIDAVHRVIRPWGRRNIYAPKFGSPFRHEAALWGHHPELAFTWGSFSQLVLSPRFSRMDCYEDQSAKHGRKSAARRVLWKCFRGLLRLYLAAEINDTGRGTIFSQNLLAVALRQYQGLFTQ